MRGAQVIEHAFAEHAFDHGPAGRTDGSRLRQAPLRIAHEIRLGIRRQVVLHRGALAGLEQPRMDGDQLVVVIDAQRARSDLEPEFLVQPAKRRRVIAVLELDVAVAVQLGFGPHRAGRRDRRQRLQQRLFGGAEQGQRLGARGAVDAVAGFAQDPGLQLFVGVREAVEFAQRHEVVLDVLDAGFDAALLLRIARRARVR